ncbi:hypothetical protein RRG08_035714 [Elysia crispata]|uniref:Uncharacterized protein n=1 Tax=Elysia crispata TaxID=231223 RepID=A0AAE0YIG5_9GAST|nr:hypothetical protein RRG08_035714 [Elysia crispata]
MGEDMKIEDLSVPLAGDLRRGAILGSRSLLDVMQRLRHGRKSLQASQTGGDGREKFHRLVETAVRSFTDWWRLERDGREKFHRLVETGERRP